MKLGHDPRALLTLTELERSVLHALAARLGGDGVSLLAQSAHATVLARSHSGVGFVTRLEVADAVPGIAGGGGMHPVRASHPELAEPAEFLVELKAGRLSSIEAYCHDGLWPADERAFRIDPARPGA